ncbi:hypothetical protein BH09PAT2_BH09PAT2_01370 [soil metagenome]
MNKKIIISVLGGLILGILFITLFFPGQNGIIALMNKYKLLPQPERLTELYLEDHTHLPTTYKRGPNNRFKFTIHNLEHEQFTYDYVVSAVSTESARIIDKGTFTLEHDGYKTIQERISTPEAVQRTKINISLENKDQSIHFWVDKAVEPTIDQK